ncbi:MAG: zinc ribbon domain-containing protein [Chloroflexi bacterium]|nr:zinc ribbon domain-containing protein [Chloroflexota bacterium]
MATKKKLEKENRFCPYCDEEIAEASWPYCQACQVTVFYCPECRKPVPRDKRVCPSCGAAIKG